MRLCSTGQISSNRLARSLMIVEERYRLSNEDCVTFGRMLDDSSSANGGGKGGVDNTTYHDWRYRIARWMLKVSNCLVVVSYPPFLSKYDLDYYSSFERKTPFIQSADDLSFNRSTAIIALMYCDRYFILLLNRKGDDNDIINRRLYQLVSISCLFLASKLYETRPVKLVDLMKYSRGEFDRNDILCMEGRLLASLLVFLHPPNAGTFCLIILSGFRSFPMSVSCAIDTCHFLIELAACGKKDRERMAHTIHGLFFFSGPGLTSTRFFFGPCHLHTHDHARLLLRSPQTIQVGVRRHRRCDGTDANVERNDPR
jgi:hypothetical protein